MMTMTMTCLSASNSNTEERPRPIPPPSRDDSSPSLPTFVPFFIVLFLSPHSHQLRCHLDLLILHPTKKYMITDFDTVMCDRFCLACPFAQMILVAVRASIERIATCYFVDRFTDLRCPESKASLINFDNMVFYVLFPQCNPLQHDSAGLNNHTLQCYCVRRCALIL